MLGGLDGGRGLPLRDVPKVVAIKKAKVSALDREVGGIGFTVLREIKLMQAVRHPNVMGCLDVFADGGTIHIVMDFMDGDLRKVVEEKGVVLNETHVKCLARQVLWRPQHPQHTPS